MPTFGEMLAGTAEPTLRRSVIDPVTGKPYSLAAPTGEVVERGSVLPIGRDDAGRLVPAVPGMLKSAAEAAAFPGQVARGEFSIFDRQTGHVSDEAIGKGMDLAGLAMTGSLPFSAPKGALRTFGGRNAATADQAALTNAEKLAAGGADRQTIWDQTGWFKGADDKWRFEINDVPSFLKGSGSASQIAADRGAALGRAKGEATIADTFHHPDLIKAYQDLGEARLRGFTAPENNRGAWTPGDPLDIDRNASLMLNNALRGNDAKSVALHELQHGIQEIEGFARGGNPETFRTPDNLQWGRTYQAASQAQNRVSMLGEDPRAAAEFVAKHNGQDADQLHYLISAYSPQEISNFIDLRSPMELYRRQAGEVEARNVQARMKMTPAERRASPPWATQDVADENQLVRFARGGRQMSMAADDPLAALTAALSGIEREAPAPGPRTLDPNAKSWDLFHGSGGGDDFARFDPSKASNPSERGALFFAPDAEAASGYASGTGAGAAAGPRVFRTTVEPGKTDVIDIGRLAETDPAFNARARELTLADSPGYEQVFDDYMSSFRASRADDARVAQQMQEMGFPPDPNAATRISYGHGHIGAAIERAKAQGLDTAILRGLVEHGGDDQVVALTPGRVRSFYAPDQVLFSGGPAGALPGVAASAFSGSQQNPGFESNLGSLSRAYMTRK